MSSTLVSFDELYQSAKQVVNPRRLSTWATAGSVGAAILSDSNTIYRGVCIDTACSMGFCAEHAAAAAMIAAGEHRILKMVAVDRDGHVMPPCGRCREFVSQLHEDNSGTEVVIDDDGTVVKLEALLPYR